MRKFLQDLGNENLVGGGRTPQNTADTAKTAKPLDQTFDDQQIRAADQKEKATMATVNPSLYNKLILNDLTSTAGPSERYWEVIAERRRKALEDVLEENQRLHALIATLEEENMACKRLIENTTDLVNTLKEVINEGQYSCDDELSTEGDSGLNTPDSYASDQHVHKKIKLSNSDESSDSN